MIFLNNILSDNIKCVEGLHMSLTQWQIWRLPEYVVFFLRFFLKNVNSKINIEIKTYALCFGNPICIRISSADGVCLLLIVSFRWCLVGKSAEAISRLHFLLLIKGDNSSSFPVRDDWGFKMCVNIIKNHLYRVLCRIV